MIHWLPIRPCSILCPIPGVCPVESWSLTHTIIGHNQLIFYLMSLAMVNASHDINLSRSSVDASNNDSRLPANHDTSQFLGLAHDTEDDQIPILGVQGKFRSTYFTRAPAYRIRAPASNFVSHLAHGAGIPRALDSIGQKSGHLMRKFSPLPRGNDRKFTRLDKFHTRAMYGSISGLDDESIYLNGWTRSKWVLIITILIVSPVQLIRMG